MKWLLFMAIIVYFPSHCFAFPQSLPENFPMLDIEKFCSDQAEKIGIRNYNVNSPFRQTCLRRQNRARESVIYQIGHTRKQIVEYCTKQTNTQPSYEIMLACLQNKSTPELAAQESRKQFAEEETRKAKEVQKRREETTAIKTSRTMALEKNINDNFDFKRHDIAVSCKEERQHGVVCVLHFPCNFSIGEIPPRYIHDIEQISLEVIRFFYRKIDHDLTLQGVIDVNSSPEPVCTYSYYVYFDMIERYN